MLRRRVIRKSGRAQFHFDSILSEFEHYQRTVFVILRNIQTEVMDLPFSMICFNMHYNILLS